MSSINDIATSATTSRLRSRRRELPKPPSPCVFLPPALSDVLRSTRAARSAGVRPKMRPVTTDTPKVNASTVPSRLMASSRGMLPGLTVRTTYSAAFAMSRPAAPPSRPSSRLSVRSCRTSRCHPAPSAVRTAISFCRLVGARQQQVGDVCASNQQHQRHRAEQHQQGAPDVADDRFDERHDVDRERSISLVFVANPRRDGGDIRVRLRDRHAPV